METRRVEGTHNHHVKLFTLSTCIWCRKAKALLNTMQVGYDYIDVDLLEDVQREEALGELKRFNPRCSFPSLVVDGKECVVGYNEEKIREALQA